MIVTEVVNIQGLYGRRAQLILIDDKIEFDNSAGEYKACIFDIEFLQRKIDKHLKKLKEGEK